MRILGNPILGLNFKHHNQHLLLNNDGLFYVNILKTRKDMILLTNDYKLILEMMEFDMTKNYSNTNGEDDSKDENVLLVMEELEKSPRFFRSFFRQNEMGEEFNELYYVKTFMTYLKSKKEFTERTFKRFTCFELNNWFPFLFDAVEESTNFLKNIQPVKTIMTGSTLRAYLPNITNEEIGQVITQWNDLPLKTRVLVFLANPLDKILKELINPE